MQQYQFLTGSVEVLLATRRATPAAISFFIPRIHQDRCVDASLPQEIGDRFRTGTHFSP